MARSSHQPAANMNNSSSWDTQTLLDADRQHIWHPYSSVNSTMPIYPVSHCEGVEIILTDGRRLLDGMASWWSAIHGYNHPVLNAALQQQTGRMAHVMFGGLTHEPAVALASKLVAMTPAGLEQVFFCDSGSVAVEVALKMAVQYWHSRGEPQRKQFLSLRNGYHGDTFGAMSVCDPVTGMHQLFNGFLPHNYFAEAPTCGFYEPCTDEHLADITRLVEAHHRQLAAVILEPVVQGAGGMRFYSPEYLGRVRKLCDDFGILLIADEIATGFGRSGKLFACEYANISPDILCLGKALTGGYMTLAATLCTQDVANTICAGEAGCFMHGPTFMANPLACAVANASLELLEQNNWQQQVSTLQQGLETGLAPCRDLSAVAEVRTLGAIGVVEMKNPVNMQEIVPALVNRGVWLRPFGKLVYMMPPYSTSEDELARISRATVEVLNSLYGN